jgi:serine/threonine-protein kinase RsbW
MPRAHTAVERHVEFSRTYPGAPVQVARVRHDVHAWLDGHPASDDVVLAVSELASNAVQHVPCLGGTFDVHVEIYPTYIWVEVIDAGGDWTVSPPGDHGRGLVLVEALSGGSWGTERTDTGSRIVWARVAS